MTTSSKLGAGAPFPEYVWPLTTGGDLNVARTPGWRVLIVYRGKHCPRCTTYFKTLDGLLEGFKAAGISVAAVSADPAEKANASVTENGWRFPVAYGLTMDQMRTLGLYVSEPRSPQETDRPFAEPGLFVVNPEGRVQIADISNAPFARPDLQGVLNGLKFVQEKKYPMRG